MRKYTLMHDVLLSVWIQEQARVRNSIRSMGGYSSGSFVRPTRGQDG